MEKEGNSQLELFSQSPEAQDFKANAANPFLKRIWNYEKTILIIIALLVTGIIAFSLGVEKGKSIVAPAPQLIVRKEEVVKQAQALSAQQPGAFTIQVASFKAKANALKEAEFIKKQGLAVMLFSKGGYFILCAGNFPTKEAALASVTGLNKRYGNCQIRRL